jgi:hypothetical protein
MSPWGYMFLGWGITIGMVVAYVVVLVVRGRSLSRQVPPGEQRWL